MCMIVIYCNKDKKEYKELTCILIDHEFFCFFGDRKETEGFVTRLGLNNMWGHLSIKYLKANIIAKIILILCLDFSCNKRICPH